MTTKFEVSGILCLLYAWLSLAKNPSVISENCRVAFLVSLIVSVTEKNTQSQSITIAHFNYISDGNTLHFQMRNYLVIADVLPREHGALDDI